MKKLEKINLKVIVTPKKHLKKNTKKSKYITLSINFTQYETNLQPI